MKWHGHARRGERRVISADLLGVLREGDQNQSLLDNWESDRVLISETPFTFVLAPGNQGRAMSCLECGHAVAAEPVRQAIVLTGRPCPDCGDHLLACALYVHTRCMPVDRDRAVRLAMSYLAPEAR